MNAQPRTTRSGPETLQRAHIHLLTGEHNATTLARRLRISVATAMRFVEELRRKLARRDQELVSIRGAGGWHYEIRDVHGLEKALQDPLVALVIPMKRVRGEKLKDEDAEIYGRV